MAADVVLDLGPQALCNRYLRDRGEDEERFPLAMAQCASCGLLQLASPAPPDALRPRFDWINYNEAEGHLDDLVARVWALPGVGPQTVVAGVSSKDDSTLARFRALGCEKVWRIDPAGDLGASASSGLETVQARLTPETAATLARARGLADVLIARHILEHAHATRDFIEALSGLVKPGGYIVFEVPDCLPAITRRDYTTVWEEHILYLTEPLFREGLRAWGLQEVWTAAYPYDHENSLVAIATPGGALAAQVAAGAAELMAKGAALGRELPADRAAVRQALESARVSGGVALFGAGHLSGMWLNVMECADLISFVADDDPNKAGLFMPGSRVPILPSSRLLDGVSLCLLSLNQESERRVVARGQPFLDAGGRFQSIFPGRDNSLLRRS